MRHGLSNTRALKYVLARGIPKQVGSLVEDKEKAALIALAAPGASPHGPQPAGPRPIYRASLLAKLFLIALLKFATLDRGGWASKWKPAARLV